MNPIIIEIIGIVSTLLILTSMLFKTTTIKGSILMRILNLIGSLTFVLYGILIPAYSTAILNAGLVLVNGYHLIILIKENKKNQATSQTKLNIENNVSNVIKDDNKSN
ncbi:MAG: hypothetical protein ACI4PF_02755 [Christensenellales bacterium]